MRLSLIPRSRTIAATAVAALLGGMLASIALAAPAASAATTDPDISVTAATTASVLDGSAASVTLTATNKTAASTGTDLYNLTYGYIIPTGVQYVANSAGAAAGEPTQTTGTFTDANGKQVTGTLLVWSDVSDLLAGDAKSLAFQVKSLDSSFPVGSSFAGSAEVAASSTARTVPTISGTNVIGNATNQASSESNATAVSALKITKSEPSPETELMRGVHDHVTVYTLTVTNTAQAATNNVTVTDDLPAGLEFLQCGGIDNTSGGAVEYPGAPRLSAATGPSTGSWTASDCTSNTPTSVSTTNTVAGQGGKVFTEVQWNIGNLAAGETRTIQYLAAIPLRENTMTFPGTTPTAASLGQAANLDNNTGASTRQDSTDTTANAQGETNLARTSGTYTGTNSAGAAASTQTASTSYTVKASDLSIVKSVALPSGTTSFASGQFATYSLRIRSSEYDSDAGMTITDVLPNGLCPAFDPTNVQETGDPFPASCDPKQTPSMNRPVQNATLQSVAYSASAGTFTLTMTIPDIATDADSQTAGTNVSYQALMRPSYSSSSSAGPTAAGDSFTNKVGISGTSTGVNGESGTQAVVDDSSATITSNSPSIAKKVLPQADSTNLSSAQDCATGSRPGQYADGTAAGSFQYGDLVCFQLSVSFPAGVESRNATVADMLPVDTASLSGNGWVQNTDWAYGSASTVPASDVALASSSSQNATFNVGHSVDGATGRYVDGGASGSTLVLYVIGRITTSGSSTSKPDLVGNLMKFSQQNTAGAVTSLRDQAGYTVSSGPAVGLVKRITANSDAAYPVGSPTASTSGVEGDTITSTLAVSNTGTAAAGNAVTEQNVVAWDALPAGVTCSTVQFTLPSGTTAQCGNAPTGAASSTSGDQYVIFTIASIPAGQTVTPTYSYVIPNGQALGSKVVNRASVVQLDTASTSAGATSALTGTTGLQTFRTANSDTTNSLDQAAIPSGTPTIPAANSNTTVTIPNVTLGKTGGAVAGTGTDSAGDPVASTNLTGANGVGGQATSWTYTASVPAGATVYNGLAKENWPAALVATASTTTITVSEATNGTTTQLASTPWGTAATFSDAGGTGGFQITGAGSLQFPTTYDNSSPNAIVFQVTIAGATISPTLLTTPGSTAAITNQVGFTSTTGTKTLANGGSAATAPASKTATVTDVAPNPVVAKNESTNATGAGQEVDYTVDVSNPVSSGRTQASSANANDVLIVDCLPAGLEYVANSLQSTAGTAPTLLFAPGSGSTPSDATCASGTPYGAVYDTLTPGATSRLVLKAIIDPTSAAAQSYRNTATITASSLANAKRATASETVVSASDYKDVSVISPQIAKSVTTAHGTAGPTANASAPAGDTATYTFTATIPANVNLYGAFISDQLPAGMTQASSPAPTTTSSDGSITPTQLPSGTKNGRTVVGFALGDVTSAAQQRTVTVTVPVLVPLSSSDGEQYSNIVDLDWNLTQGSQPTSATSSSDESIASTPVVVTAQVPTLQIAKAASTTAPTPAVPYSYTLHVSDSGTGSAYTTSVTDHVPAGIRIGQVQGGGTADAGAIAGTGGTITWTGLTVPAGGSIDLTYAATLSPSDQLDGSALQNRAGVDSYTSLPSGGGQTYSPISTTSTVTAVFPAVTLAKTAGASLAYIGQPFPWTVTLTNGSTAAPASAIAATDTLPANWTYDAGSATVSIGGRQYPVEPSTSTTDGVETLTWADLGASANDPTLAAGGQWTLHYTATPQQAVTSAPGVGDTVAQKNVLAAVVTDASGATHDANGADDGSFVTNDHHETSASTRIDEADLAITKTAATTAPTAGAGSEDAWTIAVTNKGPDTAVGPIVVTDTPGDLHGATITGASGTDWTCTVPDGGTTAPFTCTYSGSLASGASASIDVTASLPSGLAAGTELDNTASVSDAQQGTDANGGPITFGTYDPDHANNSATATTVVSNTRSQLQIVKTGPASVQAGQAGALQYSLAVSNPTGPSDTAGLVDVTDTLPTGTTATSATGDGWTCSIQDRTVDCTRSDALAPGASFPAIAIVGTVGSGVTGTLHNTAGVAWTDGADTAEHATSNTVDTSVDDSATLSVTKTLTSYTPGAHGVYTIDVAATENAADAVGVTVHDELPDRLTYVGVDTETASSTGGDWTCTPSSNDTVVDCALDGSIVSGKDATLALTVAVPSGIRSEVVNTATASATNAQPASGRSTTGSAPLTDLRITKTHSTADVVAGQSVDYAITVTNAGPSDILAGDITTVTDHLPTGETFDAATFQSADWTAEQHGQTVVFTTTMGVVVGADFPPIPYRAAIASSVAGGTALDNVATAFSTNASQSVAATDTVTPRAEADLSITKRLDQGSSTVAGTTATWTITVDNAGPSDARAVTLDDLADQGLQVVGAKQLSGDDTWDCTDSGCSIDELAPGTSTFRVTTDIASAVRPSALDNRATIDWTDSSGTRTANGTASIDVTDLASLALTKTAVDTDGDPITSIAAGQEVDWRIAVHDDGPSDASGIIRVSDTLADGLTYRGVTSGSAAAGWTCTDDQGTLTCDLDAAIADDHDAPALVIRTAVDPALAARTISNSATVVSTTTPGGNGIHGGGTSIDETPLVNLDIAISHTGTGIIGQRTPFTVTVANTGPSVATGVRTTVTLPKGLTFADTTGTASAWSAGKPVVHADGTTTIEFTLDGSLAPGATAPTIVVGTTVEPGAYPKATVDASTKADEAETTMTDNTAADPLTVAPLSSLSVTKTHTQQVQRGSTVGYVITVHNDGPTADPGPVTVTDALPKGLSFVSADPGGKATCTSGGNVVCTLTSALAVDGSVQIIVTTKVAQNAPDEITNTAVVASASAQSTAAVTGSDPTPLTASDPAPVHAAPKALAFTGSTGVLWALFAGLLAVGGGLGFRAIGRSRREPGPRRRG